ncbi:MAG: phophatidylserine decarboxylase associated domain-containing protein [Geminicoccaceae bacterium]
MDSHGGTQLTDKHLKEHHHHRLAVRNGHLSGDFDEINKYQLHVLAEITKNPNAPLLPEIAALRDTIAREPFVRMYLERMLHEVPKNRQHFTTIDMMLRAMNFVVHSAPIYKDVETISWQFPLSALMNFWMMTPSGMAALRMPQLNDHINCIMKAWCKFLDSPKSLFVLNEGPEGWLCPAAYKYNDLDSYIIPDKNKPHWGWKSYNEFFHRDIKPECRPIDGPNDPSIVNSPNDGVAWALQYDVKAEDAFWLKSQRYSLADMLNYSPLTESFVGGIVYQTYVNGGADWHRFASPIDGTVVDAQIITGYAWTETDTAIPDPTSGTYSQGWAAGVATRGLIFVDSGIKPLGIVCIVPIGLTEVSSLDCYVKKGQRVKKGDQLGAFSFGGSSFAIVFQPGAVKEILVPPPPHGRNHQAKDTLQTNRRCAIANV